MRIMHIIIGMGAGGAENALLRLIESLPPPEFEHSVIALCEEGPLSARVRAAGARLEHLDVRQGRINPRAVFRVRRKLRLERPDVLHGWMYHSNFLALLANMGGAVYLVWGIRHSVYKLSHEKRLTRALIKVGAYFSCKPKVILYNSRVSAEQHEALGYRRDRSLVIPNGFDTQVFKPDSQSRSRIRQELSIPDEALVIGLIARIHPVKDHENFLRAAASFKQAHPDTVFVLVGKHVQNDNDEFVRRLDYWGLCSSVRLCGRRDDVTAINAALDIATNASWGEAFPNAVGEAMACGVPCVVTRVGDSPDIVGDTGIVVPPRDSSALCAGWSRLAELGLSGRAQLGRQARERIIERYSLGAVTRRYADVYRQMVAPGDAAVSHDVYD